MAAWAALAFNAFALPEALRAQPVRQDPKPTRYAAIVVDEKTGTVLYEYNAARVLFPASTTKLMTAYLFFRAKEQGLITLDQDLPISALAASQGKTNLSLMKDVRVKDVTTAKNGRKIISYHTEQQQKLTSIKAEDALRGMLCHSSNDAAVILAEALGGSVDGFAQMMNAEAKRLGMDQTHYVNPNGMPDTRQVTSVQDMAKLARALIEDFPDDYKYFDIRSFTFNGATYQNTNHELLGSDPEVDGMKTGWIAMSGFNLVASAHRKDQRVIGIVYGANTSEQRTVDMRRLLDFGFAKEKNPKAVFAYGQDTGPMQGKIKIVRTLDIPPKEILPPPVLSVQGNTTLPSLPTTLPTIAPPPTAAAKPDKPPQF
jgi:D-alanyl-D-alanine carboxypeptidase